MGAARFSRALAAALLLAAQPAQAGRGNLEHLLFYTCVTKEVHNQCEGSYSLDQAGIVNRGFTANTTLIEVAAARFGIRSFFAVHDVFFVNGQGMQPDWRGRWTAAQTALRPLIESSALAGFFMGDELISGHKIPWSDFSLALGAVDQVRQSYSNLSSPLLIWGNEGGTNWPSKVPNGTLPSALDAISIDDYTLSVEGHREWYNQHLYPMMQPHQRAFLVPGSFGTRYNISTSRWCGGGSTEADCDRWMVNNTRAFLGWALDDDRVIGFAPWHWDTRGKEEVSINKEVGTVELPLLKAEWRRIGQIVRRNEALSETSSLV